MTTVLVVNAGSSSLKLRVLGGDDSVTSALDVDPWDGTPHHAEMAAFLAAAGAVDVVAHRVVHGGSRFAGPALIDDSVIAAIADLADLAPLHQARALAGIEACRAGLPGVPAVACFDTAFHATLPEAAARYALPGDWTSRFGTAGGSGGSSPLVELRRYGFHGLSHAYAARRAGALVGRDLGQLKIITCHLGAGASLAAVQAGRCVDTTMGFTPLEGLVMATRSGSVDPGLVLWLQRRGGLGVDEVGAGLERASGLAGLAELPDGSGDMRDVHAAAQAGDPRARLAVEVYLHRLRREIAAMAAAMDGVDVLAFTGGVGEHQPPIRAGAAGGLGFLGVSIDPDRNQAVADADITGPAGAVRVLVITAREDLEIARQARELVRV
jgi:acetate kinase